MSEPPRVGGVGPRGAGRATNPGEGGGTGGLAGEV